MRRRSLYIGLLAGLLAASGVAEARMHHPYRGHRIVAVASAPLDGFAAPSGAYSFRKLKSTYAGPAVRLRRASDNAELDIGFLGFSGFTGAPWDEAAAAAHCAATSCFITIWYDQSGNARNVGNATVANQPALAFNCKGTLPCVQSDATDFFSGASFTPATGLVSLNVVANRTSGTGPCGFLRENGAAAANVMQAANGIANTWRLVGSGFIGATATDAAWHTAIGIVDGASSALTVDGGAPVTGTVTAILTGGVTIVGSGTTTTVCSIAEGVFWDNYRLLPAEAAGWQANQKSYWGTP